MDQKVFEQNSSVTAGQAQRNCHYIVAIGGSAGSLSPIKEFFDHTPHDNAAYVIVQHYPRGYQSQLQRILKKHSSLEVTVITEGMPVSSDKVYLLPAGYYAGIRGKQFHLIDRMGTINKSIDTFLTSLAAQQFYRPIAVILSGASNDGTQGIVSVKNAGGLTIAQKPRTCQFPVMPESAIATGSIDRVMHCKDMPDAIVEYITRNH